MKKKNLKYQNCSFINPGPVALIIKPYRAWNIPSSTQASAFKER